MNKTKLIHIASRIAWWSVLVLWLYAIYYYTQNPMPNCVETPSNTCYDEFGRAG